jgi:signal transduction histidine kinase
VLIAFLIPLAVLLARLATDHALADGRQQAQSVAALVAVTDARQLGEALLVVNQRSAVRVGVVLVNGTPVGPPYLGTAQALALASKGRSFTASAHGGRIIYVPVDSSAGRAVVWAFVPSRWLHRGVATAVSVLLGLGASLLLLTLLLADRLARGTVGPVRAMAGTAIALGSGDLEARAPVAGPPEVREVGHALNLLAHRIGELLRAEREAVADLSHRLRTPLTRLRLDVDTVADTGRRERLMRDVEDLQLQVDGVIQEARRQVRTGVQATCDAAEVVRDRTTFWRVLFDDKERGLAVELPASACPVRTAAEDLGAAVDALLQNALTHTPGGTAVRVSVSVRADGPCVVTVADEGPGLPAGAAQRGASRAGSTGLGLDIARRTAEASGGRMLLGQEPGAGGRVTLELGPPL